MYAVPTHIRKLRSDNRLRICDILIQPFLSGLHGVSIGVPLVFPGFDRKNAATKFGFAACFQIAPNQTQAPATAS